MKIFSWVHRRFRHKDEASLDVKKTEFLGIDNENLALLETAASACMFDGWRGSILAIGTLGIDLLEDFNPKDDNELLQLVGDEDDIEEGEMEYPLVFRASKHGFDHVQNQDGSSPCDKQLVAEPNINGQEDVGLQGVTKVRKSGGRTTLADLLWADSENNLLRNNKLSVDHKDYKPPYHGSSTCTASIKKHDDRVSLMISKKKIKKMLNKAELAHPIMKANRLMRKMLKRKIHPDMEIQKKETAGMKPPSSVK